MWMTWESKYSYDHTQPYIPIILNLALFADEGFHGGSAGEEPDCQCKRCREIGQSLGWEDRLEKEMATHSSILAYKTPQTEGTGRLHSPWSHKESDTTVQPIQLFADTRYTVSLQLWPQ